MTNKEIAKAANCGTDFLYKMQRKDGSGYPSSGTDEDKIEFLLTNKDQTRGRKPAKTKLKTNPELAAIAKRKALADLAKREQEIEKNQYKIIAERDEMFLKLLGESLNGFMEDLKECQLPRPTLTFLRERTKERLETLSASLKELRES